MLASKMPNKTELIIVISTAIITERHSG